MPFAALRTSVLVPHLICRCVAVQAQLFGVLSVLVSMMFSGMNPRFVQLRIILGGVLMYPTYLSFIRSVVMSVKLEGVAGFGSTLLLLSLAAWMCELLDFRRCLTPPRCALCVIWQLNTAALVALIFSCPQMGTGGLLPERDHTLPGQKSHDSCSINCL